jgi:hypothetical protein
MRKMRNAYKILIENPEEKTPLGRPRRRLKNNGKAERDIAVWTEK